MVTSTRPALGRGVGKSNGLNGHSASNSVLSLSVPGRHKLTNPFGGGQDAVFPLHLPIRGSAVLTTHDDASQANHMGIMNGLLWPVRSGQEEGGAWQSIF